MCYYFCLKLSLADTGWFWCVEFVYTALGPQGEVDVSSDLDNTSSVFLGPCGTSLESLQKSSDKFSAYLPL